MDSPKPEQNKAGWLEHLEAESWSAELIISGAAIYGSLQLPWLLNKLVDFCLLQLSDEMLDIMYLVFIYLSFTVTILIINFIVHFILRSLWVGMIGLASVYPDGVNENSDSFSQSYLQRLKADYGDLRGFNARLDQSCSLIFAFSFAFSMTMLNFALMVFIAAGLAYVLTATLLPHQSINSIFLIIMSLILMPAMMAGFLNMKALREKAWVQKIHYPLIVKTISKLINHIFHEPLQYINNTFVTNIKKGRYTLGVFAYMFLTIPIFAITILQSNMVLAKKEIYFKHANRPDRYYAQHYEDRLQEGEMILAPLIPSDQIQGAGLTLFLPLPTREELVMHKKYGAHKDDPKLSEEENLIQARAWFKEEAAKYFQIEINGKKFKPSFRSTNHPNANEYGMITFVPANMLVTGENLIHVSSDYWYKGKRRESFITFLYGVE